jgi:hypothetical protein
MRELPAAETGPTTRTRRWDAVILGGALPGLVAAVRLGMRGARVLVVEEEAALQRFAGLREPFWMSGAHRDGVLGACLRALRVPLIDQRRIEPDPLAFQVVLPDARLDLGEPRLTVDEWVAWGLAKPESARALVRALADAAAGEREAMFQTPVVRMPRRLRRQGRQPAAAAEPAATRSDAKPARRSRGLPGELEDASPRLAYLLAAQTRAPSNLGVTASSAAARSRLLGAPLEGGAAVRGGNTWLRELLRRRIESLYGEFRTLPETFRLVSSNGQPGVAPDAAGESGEIWVGRAFLLNASPQALAAAVCQEPVPEILQAPPVRRRRISLHLRVERDALPEGMASRVIVVGDTALPPDDTNVVSLRRFAPSGGSGRVDLVASAVVAADEADLAAREAEIEARVASLMPFVAGRLARVPGPEPRWDHDALLADPPPGAGWPAEVSLRLPTRQPIHQLDRAPLGGLGFEGDLLLGWRGGDAIAADLA